MRKHTGIRPQDIVILVKILSYGQQPWLAKDLAISLFLSGSEVSESLHRSAYAGLIDKNKKKVLKLNFMEFISHGLRYTFPQQPGAMQRGMPTAFSHPEIQPRFPTDIKLVWPDPDGHDFGWTIEPFYEKQVKAAKQDDTLYYMLCLIDMIRVGKPREVNFAKEELKKWFEDL